MKTGDLLASIIDALQGEAVHVTRSGEPMHSPKPQSVIVITDVSETGIQTYRGYSSSHLIQVSVYTDVYAQTLEISERCKEILALPEGLNMLFRSGRLAPDQEDGRKGRILEFEI